MIHRNQARTKEIAIRRMTVVRQVFVILRMRTKTLEVVMKSLRMSRKKKKTRVSIDRIGYVLLIVPFRLLTVFEYRKNENRPVTPTKNLINQRRGTVQWVLLLFNQEFRVHHLIGQHQSSRRKAVQS